MRISPPAGMCSEAEIKERSTRGDVHELELDDSGEPTVVADDGNFDVCAVCGEGGSLICCEACPQAYHADCLGPDAPPEDEDDDSAWFCPPCALQLGMRQGAA